MTHHALRFARCHEMEVVLGQPQALAANAASSYRRDRPPPFVRRLIAAAHLTEITPGRPTIFEHRHPYDEIRRPMTAPAAEPQSVLNALTIVSAEQQTMNFYMTIGNRYQEPIARATYAEIGMIEEQHVTHYGSMLDPAASWLENLVMHQWHECWAYWSMMQDEPST